MKQRIIILGGEGYIGRVLSDYFLKKKKIVISIDNLIYKQNEPKNRKNFKFFKINLKEKKKYLI